MTKRRYIQLNSSKHSTSTISSPVMLLCMVTTKWWWRRSHKPSKRKRRDNKRRKDEQKESKRKDLRTHYEWCKLRCTHRIPPNFKSIYIVKVAAVLSSLTAIALEFIQKPYRIGFLNSNCIESYYSQTHTQTHTQTNESKKRISLFLCLILSALDFYRS